MPLFCSTASSPPWFNGEYLVSIREINTALAVRGSDWEERLGNERPDGSDEGRWTYMTASLGNKAEK